MRTRPNACSKKSALPDNIDPSNPKLDDAAERNRMMRTFERKLTHPAGFVLPVQHWTAQAKPGWLSELWQTRRGRLYLIPGDSPAGLRLPLGSLPYFDYGRLSASGAGRSLRRPPAFAGAGGNRSRHRAPKHRRSRRKC